MSIVDRAIEAAKKYLHVREVNGNNRGPDVERILARVNLPPGQPWCMAFVYALLDDAGVKSWPKTGYCPYVEDWARQHGILHKRPQRGDGLLLQMHDAQGQYSGHTGLVTEVVGEYVKTIEGNTSSGAAGSQDDGGGVYARTRAIKDCLFVAWAELPANATPPLTVTFEGHLVDCHPRNEGGTTRADLRKVVEALGFQLVLKPNQIDIIERA